LNEKIGFVAAFVAASVFLLQILYMAYRNIINGTSWQNKTK